MRTIKFRGKRLHDGKWVYGYVLGHDTLPYMAIVTMNNTDKSVINKTTTSVDPGTIGQFTGLCDKNGKEIYEGDIIKHGTFIGVVDWHPIGNFFINENYGKRQDKCISLGEMLENHSFIVVGNIHDNPKLI